MQITMDSKAVLAAYVARSWRFLIEQQQAEGAEFVMGKREGSYFWNLEGNRRILDCGNSGGTHSFGHRNPELVEALVGALAYLDAGIWTMPTPEHLALQDTLATSAPAPRLSRSVATLGSTESIDLAIMFAFRVTGRRKVVAYRHGYHGHSGFAALATGSDVDGLMEHYALPTNYSAFFDEYGSVDSVVRCLDENCAAVILEPMNYETFKPAPAEFLPGLADVCRERGVLLVIDETRTGLGRSGRLWMTSHYGFEPDMVILGKGLGGGLYPVSALLTTQAIYDPCMNSTRWGYQSALAGSPIAAVVATKVLELAQRAALLENVRRLETALATGFHDLCVTFPDVYAPGWTVGGIAALVIAEKYAARNIKSELFKRNVMCHSVSTIEPCVVKFLPCLTSDSAVIGEIIQALSDFATKLRTRPSPKL